MEISKQIDKKVASYGDWRTELMMELRRIINNADPEIQEDWKWGTAVWTHHGLVCALSGFKDHVKVNFFKGAYLKDSGKLINAGFDSKEHRAIDLKEGDLVNVAKLRDLIKEAIAYNLEN